MSESGDFRSGIGQWLGIGFECGKFSGRKIVIRFFIGKKGIFFK